MSKLLLAVLVAGSSAAQPAARVYIFSQAAALPSNPIWCDGVKTAQLRPDRFFALNLPPGRHSFSGRQPSEQIILELTAGETFYLRLDRVFPYPGGPPNQPDDWYDRLTPASAADAGRIINTLPAIDPKDVFAPEHVTLDRPQGKRKK